MKISKTAVHLTLLSILLSSCAKEEYKTDDNSDYPKEEVTEKPKEEVIDDQPDASSLTYLKANLSVTLNICNDFYCSVQQLDFPFENTGYAVTSVDVYRTFDAGENWDKIVNNDIIGRLIVVSEDLLYLNTYEGILKSIDGGVSWSTITKPIPFTCPDTGSINEGIIFFVDELTGFIQDSCSRGQLLKTSNSGDTWEKIYDSEDKISAYNFIDELNGFVIVNDSIYTTENGGEEWVQNEILPGSFDFVIEKADYFLFPEGMPNVPKPSLTNENFIITKFAANDLGDIAIILHDDFNDNDNWRLMLFVNDRAEWIYIDQLDDLGNDYSSYSSIYLTNEKTIYVSSDDSGEITKYYLE